MPLPLGTLLHNRYRIISILGQGGMGAVYRATDEHLHIPVAVKENLFLTEEYGRQFQREAHILAGLRHPNLPHVTDYFSTENQVQYLVMDYIEGEDLRQRMERLGALPERETVLIGISICDALTYLHTRHPPIVHRDIKPGNIKVTPGGQAVLVDFGLAKIMEGSQVTSTGARAMTPGYSPPEQYGTARTDSRSDIYSLGATLYATLTGVIPEESLQRVTNRAKLTSIREMAPKVSRKLAEAVECALEIDPDDRFQSAEELKENLIESGDLASYFLPPPIITPPPSPVVLMENGEEALEPAEAVVDSSKIRERSLSRSRARRLRRKILRWALVPIIAALAVGGYLLFAMRPDLTRSVLAYFSPSPSPSQTTAAVALENSITSTPAEQQVTTPQPLEPTADLAAPPAATEISETPSTPSVAQTLLPTATPQGGGMGQIAFASDRTGIMEVWVMDVATPKNRRQITNLQDGACQPTWSPDGMRLAFISPCRKKQDLYKGSNIYTINLDTTGAPIQDSLTQVSFSLEGDFDPAWSPDGKRIAFTSLSNGKASIYLINLDDPSTVIDLSKSKYADRHPSWSPSGMQLAFVRQTPNSQIWYMTDNGQFQKQFSIPGPFNDLWPAWSTDGSIIFYSQTSQDSSVPYLVYRYYEDRNASVENRVPTDPNSGPIAEVSPSPDGFWLTYEGWQAGDNHDIYIMNTNGSNLSRLTTDPGYDFGPVWRPLQASQP